MFEDTNGNGVQDPSEPGLPGVDVVIIDSEGNVFTLTTDATGMYTAEVPAGPTVTDIVESTLPEGSVQTVGTDPTTVDVPAGGTATDLDGFEPTGKIVGIVFEDTNGNGVQDPGEPGIPNVSVEITDSSGSKQTVITSATGMYSATVPTGPAVTDIVESTLPDGFIQTAGVDPTTVLVPAGGTATDSDGFMKPTDSPTSSPTISPTGSPTVSPTAGPTAGPTSSPTASPTAAPTPAAVTGSPTKNPTTSPTKGPTTSPTGLPTSSPTGSPTASPTPGAPSCVNATVTFDVDANGNPLAPGKYVQNEWASFGLSLSATGGEGSTPRLFDTANPGSEKTCGDADLGAPNKRCTPSGPGVGEDGEPGTEGENCSPLGNVLIIQEPDAPCPDDNKDGGVIVFDFFSPAQLVYEMTFLDIDYETKVEVIHETDSGIESTVFDLPLLGDNSKQALEINLENVRQILVKFARSGAVASIDFCYDPNDIPTAPPAAPTPAAVTPTPSPTTSPTGTPTRGPTSSPTGTPTVLPTASPTSYLLAHWLSADCQLKQEK